MNTKDIILELRTKKGLSQDELAERIMVTRQAVSRWENGETVPNTETLKLLSKEFNVTINTLLGAPKQLICQCCGMPMEDEIVGYDHEGFLNEDYCKWCYADGEYTYSNMNDLIEVSVKHLVNEGFTEEQARDHMKATLPTLDYWKRYEELSDNGQFAGLFNIPGKMGIIAKLWQLRPTMALYYGSFCNTFRYGKMNNVEATFYIYGVVIVIFAIILIMSYMKSQVESN